MFIRICIFFHDKIDLVNTTKNSEHEIHKELSLDVTLNESEKTKQYQNKRKSSIDIFEKKIRQGVNNRKLVRQCKLT